MTSQTYKSLTNINILLRDLISVHFLGKNTFRSQPHVANLAFPLCFLPTILQCLPVWGNSIFMLLELFLLR